MIGIAVKKVAAFMSLKEILVRSASSFKHCSRKRLQEFEQRLRVRDKVDISGADDEDLLHGIDDKRDRDSAL